MSAGEKADDDVRSAILAPAAAGVITPAAGLEGLSFGRYGVIASIGRGGMGEVYLARKKDAPPDAEFVALKVLLDEEGRDEELIGMFMDEASIMAQIHHPNVLAVYDFGREGQYYYLAMEYLQGRPLVRVMIDAYTRAGGMDPAIIAIIGADAGRGLHAAHVALGKNGQPLEVVHRDVSPQNIFVTYAGLSKVIDFGVARAAERVSHTTVGQLKGKAAYMSPEQINGFDIDGRSDVFALGACLWEMAAGRRLFKRQSDYDTMAAVLDGEIKPPSAFRKEIDRNLDAIILGCLERNRDKRTANGGVLSEQLWRYATKRGVREPAGAVGSIMTHLYGEIAAEERQLVRLLKDRAATAAEADALRELSGIAPRGPMRHEGVTLISRPAELSELDDFGAHEEKTLTVGAAGLVGYRSAMQSAGSHVPTQEERALAIQRAVDQLKEEYAAAVRGGRGGSAIRVSNDTWRRVLGLLPYAALVFILVAGLTASLLAWRRSRLAEEQEARAASQTAPVILTMPPIELKREEITNGRIVAVDEVLSQLRPRDVSVTRMGSTLLLSDSAGGGVLHVDADARFVEVSTKEAKGWIAVMKPQGNAAVAWIGRLGDRPWRARGLSLNDCPADAKVVDGGVELSYPKKRIVLPHGGGPLEKRLLRRPRFAERMELQPLGLAFGVADPARSAVLCSTGWVQDGVLLQRIPPGSYTVHWMGEGLIHEVPIVIEASPE